jgi:hypothetical protein
MRQVGPKPGHAPARAGARIQWWIVATVRAPLKLGSEPTKPDRGARLWRYRSRGVDITLGWHDDCRYEL